MYIADAYLNKYYTPLGKPDIKIIRNNLKPILLLSIASLFTFFYLSFGQLILNYYKISSIEIASFTNTYNRIFLTLASFPMLIMPIIASKMKKSFDKGELDIFWKYFKYAIFISISFFFIFLIVGTFLNSIIDPETKYPQTLSYIRLLSPAALIFPMTLLLGHLTVFFNKEKNELFISFIIGLVSFILSLVLVPGNGVIGFIITFVFTTYLNMFLKLSLFLKLTKQTLK